MDVSFSLLQLVDLFLIFKYNFYSILGTLYISKLQRLVLSHNRKF
jgi:hypothetical protein